MDHLASLTAEGTQKAPTVNTKGGATHHSRAHTYRVNIVQLASQFPPEAPSVPILCAGLEVAQEARPY
mgnify:CR=1 FL=1